MQVHQVGWTWKILPSLFPSMFSESVNKRGGRAGAQESKIRICKQGPPRCSQIQMSISHRKSEKILLNPPSLSKPNSPKNAFVYNSSFYLIFADQAVIILMWHAITRVLPMWHVTVIRSFKQTKVREDLTITEKAPHLRHYAKQASTHAKVSM